MEGAGWRLKSERARYVKTARYESDYVLAFCKPARGWRWLIGMECKGRAGINLFEGKVSWMNAGLSK